MGTNPFIGPEPAVLEVPTLGLSMGPLSVVVTSPGPRNVVSNTDATGKIYYSKSRDRYGTKGGWSVTTDEKKETDLSLVCSEIFIGSP